jgi:glycosyltransferase involved in cell wall biosynthesis
MKLPAEPLTILMLTHVIGRTGGIEAALVDLTADLTRRGHSVLVYSCRPPVGDNQNVARLRRAGADLASSPAWLAAIAGSSSSSRAGFIRALLLALSPLIGLAALADCLRSQRALRRSWQGAYGRARGSLGWLMDLDRLYYRRLNRLIRRNRPDLIHVHGWGCGADPPGGLAWARRSSLPIAYTEHNSPPPSADGEQALSPINLADVIIACSQAGAIGLSQTCCADKPITVIPYSVADPVPTGFTAAARPDRPFTFTCLARLNVAQKRQDDLIRAFHLLRATSPAPARLLLAGDGPDLQHLHGLVRQLDLSGSVQLLGAVPRERLPWLMAESDVMVLPSTWEGLPVSIIESMAFGKPVIASDAGGNPELVADEQSGLIVPVGGIDQLQQAMQRLMTDRELARRMGRAARERFEQGGFGPDTVGAATLAVYRRAMDAQA